MALTRIIARYECGLDLCDVTFGQGHEKPLGHKQQSCENYLNPTWRVSNQNGPEKFLGVT